MNPSDQNSAAEVQILAAGQEHAGEIARIYNHYVSVGGATFDVQHWTIDDTFQLLQLLEREGWFVAQQRQQILGWASARHFSDRHGYRNSVETAIYLDPSAVGTGAADSLQTRIERHCIDHRIRHAMAKIIANNVRSMKFHYRHGYELVGIQKEIGNMDGTWQDVAILQRLFQR